MRARFCGMITKRDDFRFIALDWKYFIGKEEEVQD